MGESWVRKYRPESTSEMQGQNKAVSKVKNFVQKYDKGEKPLLLHGPPGTGKTAAVYAVAGDLDYEVIEVNASDIRNKKGINEVVGGALGQQSLFAKGKIILVDEIDGIAGRQDRGGLKALTKLMKEANFPIIMTANDPYDQKFSNLRKKAEMVEFGNLNYRSIVARLKDVCKEEDIEYDESSLKQLARSVGGDMRGAINDLQSVASDGKLEKEDLDVLGTRLRKDSIFDALVRVFKTTDANTSRGAYNEVDVDIDEIFEWVEKNIPKEYKKPRDLMRAYDALSVADIFYGRIMNWQYYRFYVYCYDLLSAGISLAKDEKYEGFTKYQRPKKRYKIWNANRRLKKKEAIASKISVKAHMSVTDAMKSTIPYLKAGVQENEDFASTVIDFFELDEGEADWLKGE